MEAERARHKRNRYYPQTLVALILQKVTQKPAQMSLPVSDEPILALASAVAQGHGLGAALLGAGPF